MLERRERVEQWARKEEQGAGSRSHALSLGWVVTLVRRWLVGQRRRRRRRRGEEYMRAAVYGERTPFLRVSRCPVSCLGESSARRKESPPSSKRPRLSLNCRLVWTRPAFQLCCIANFHLPTCSGIGKTLPRVRSQQTGTRSFMSSMPYTLLPSIVHDHSTLANIHADQHMPAEQPPRPSRCLPTSRPPSTSGEDAQAPR